jgi:hypothetical protein
MARRYSVRDLRRRRPSWLYLPALAGSLTLAGTLTGVTGLAPAGAAVMTCQWADGAQPAPVTTEGGLISVTAPSATDAWAVGTSTGSNGDQHALIEHWNGTAWTTTPVPKMPSSILQSVRSASPASVWAVGTVQNASRQDQTLILHWNGKAWTRQPSPDPGHTFDALFGVRAVSATSAWAVGTFQSGAALRSLVLHWNGTAWKQVTSPSPAINSQLAGVAATSATSAWAVGTTGKAGTEQTLILRWDGKTWKQVTSPDPAGGDTDDSLNGVFASSAGNAWAVGDSDDGSFVLHWNGHSWQTAFGPFAFTVLSGVAASSSGDAWAVGSVTDGSGSMPQPFALHCT